MANCKQDGLCIHPSHFRVEDQSECVGIRRESLLSICHDELILRNLYCF